MISRIYVFCLSSAITGGPEALHQFSHIAKLLGYPVSLVYYPDQPTQAVLETYQEYDVNRSPSAIDAPESLIIVPEIDTQIFREFKYAKKMVWWLSVDNYIEVAKVSTLRFLRQKMKNIHRYNMREMKDISHAVQSEYARLFLLGHNVNDPFMLTDYINLSDEHVNPKNTASIRDNLILYNPKKGFEFTRQLITSSPYEWIPLEGLTRDELLSIMGRAKLYVDFGHHPGRDRLPREAVFCGCCLLTGRRGSAANQIDIPIPESYKIDEFQLGAVDVVTKKINVILTNFDDEIKNFKAYKAKIKSQKSVFNGQVEALLRSMNI